MNLLINLLLGFFVFVSVLMVLVILMQRPKSEGLGAAFGGGVTENIFGAQTTNVLVKFTTWLVGIFFVLTFALSILNAHKSTADSAFRRELMKNAGRAANFACACSGEIFAGFVTSDYAYSDFAGCLPGARFWRGCFTRRERATSRFASSLRETIRLASGLLMLQPGCKNWHDRRPHSQDVNFSGELIVGDSLKKRLNRRHAPAPSRLVARD